MSDIDKDLRALMKQWKERSDYWGKAPMDDAIGIMVARIYQICTAELRATLTLNNKRKST